MPLRRIVLCLALGILGTSLTSLAFSGGRNELPSRSFAAEISWEGPQSVHADSQGNIYLVRGDTLDVYSIARGRAAAQRRLQRPAMGDGETASVAMSPDGSHFLVSAANHILSISGARTEVLPETGWFVTSVGYLGDSAVAGVLPMQVGGLPSAGRPTTPPLILRNAGSGWGTYIEGRLPDRSRQRDPMDALFAEHTIRLATSGDGRLWVSYPYLGRIVRYAPSGKPDLQLVVGSGAARYREEKGLLTAFLDQLRGRGFDTENAKVGVFSAKLGIRGLAPAPNGMLYVVLDRSLTGRGTELARFDSARGVVESVPLPLSNEGELSMAGGREGLYLAGIRGSEARRSISYEAIAHAGWRQLAEARVGNP